MTRLQIDPEPPVQGGTMTVCYNWDGLTETEVTISIDWSPDSIQDIEIKLTRAGPEEDHTCSGDIDVPDNAESVKVTAPNSAPKTSAVSPLE